MGSAALLAVSAVQIAVFLGPLAAARAGVIDGQLAALTAVALWFVAGLPISFAIVDAAKRPGWGFRLPRRFVSSYNPPDLPCVAAMSASPSSSGQPSSP